MSYALGPVAERAGYRLVEFEEIGSTSSAALEMARAGDGGPVWVIAERQSGGHGRRGRPWQSLPGNLASSLLVTADAPAHRIATLGFVAGLALHDAISRCCSRPDTTIDRIRLKWPNDVLADGAKVAGIMLESEAVGRSGTAVVVGIGVNVAAAPEGLPYRAACLSAVGMMTTAEDLFGALTDAWVARYAQWSAGAGMAGIREAWLTRAAGVGGPVAVDMGVRRINGIFETLDAEGRLVVRADDGTRSPVSAGDVYFGESATLPAAS